MSLRERKKYKCIKDFYMNDGMRTFTAGKEYIAVYYDTGRYKYRLTNDQGYTNHYLDADLFIEYFEAEDDISSAYDRAMRIL